MPSVAVKEPVVGSYSSAMISALPVPPLPAMALPVSSTMPLPSSVAVWPLRATHMDPVGLKVPVVGS